MIYIQKAGVFIAHHDVRENAGMHICDKYKNISEKKSEFPTVDFGYIHVHIYKQVFGDVHIYMYACMLYGCMYACMHV